MKRSNILDRGDSAQANSQGSFLRLFVLLCGMTDRECHLGSYDFPMIRNGES
ncbi:MAG: hypothetical protein IK025_00735 [Bacteroidales bacterium]|nr:hypothetical protein [Bacteroidales bacterium]